MKPRLSSFLLGNAAWALLFAGTNFFTHERPTLTAPLWRYFLVMSVYNLVAWCVGRFSSGEIKSPAKIE